MQGPPYPRKHLCVVYLLMQCPLYPRKHLCVVYLLIRGSLHRSTLMWLITMISHNSSVVNYNTSQFQCG